MNCIRRWSLIPSVVTGILTGVSLAGCFEAAMAQDQSVDLTIVADKVRSQGLICDNPNSAERVEAESGPHEAVYLLKCKGVTYHVRLIPDMAATVSVVE